MLGFCGVDMFVALCAAVLRRVWFALDHRRGITVRIQDTPATGPRLSSVTDWGYMQVEVEGMDRRVFCSLVQDGDPPMIFDPATSCLGAVVYVFSSHLSSQQPQCLTFWSRSA